MAAAITYRPNCWIFGLGHGSVKCHRGGKRKFEAAISSAKEDTAHPRKAVLRALRHRGAFILTTEDIPCIIQRNSTRTWNVVENVQKPR